MTLSLDLQERHQEQPNEAQCGGKPSDRRVWLVSIVRVVASRRRFVGNTGENGRRDGETNGNC